MLLAAAGLLEGKEATTHWASLDRLPSTARSRPAERVVEQGKIITAAGVSSGIDMALTLAARIAGDEFAQAIQLGIEYDPQPPFDAGSVAKASERAIATLTVDARSPECSPAERRVTLAEFGPAAHGNLDLARRHSVPRSHPAAVV